jgi:hypothetical protein
LCSRSSSCRDCEGPARGLGYVADDVVKPVLAELDEVAGMLETLRSKVEIEDR